MNDTVLQPPSRAVATPPGRPGGLNAILTWRVIPWWAARIGIRFFGLLGRPLRLFGNVIVARHVDVVEALARDLDFHIQPVNGPPFDRIGYHFVLGMDRSAEHIAERRTLYTALAKVDQAALRAAAAEDIAARLAAAPATIDIVGDYARPIAAGTAHRLFGIGAADDAEFKDAARAIFGDSFFNLTGDKDMTVRAAAAGALFTGWFDAEIARRHAAGAVGDDMMGRLLAGGASDDLTRRTLGGILVGAIDPTASAVARVMTVLMKDEALLARAVADADDLDRIRGWCWEALRRWPNGMGLFRRAARDTDLAGTAVKRGDRLVLWTEAAMLDAQAFPDPLVLRPDRGVGPDLHLGGGLHPCAGRGINAWQIPMLVAALLRRRPVKLGRLDWAGPFPAHLPVTLVEGTR